MFRWLITILQVVSNTEHGMTFWGTVRGHLELSEKFHFFAGKLLTKPHILETYARSFEEMFFSETTWYAALVYVKLALLSYLQHSECNSTAYRI